MAFSNFNEKKNQVSKQDELNCEFERQLITYTLCNGINWLNCFIFSGGCVFVSLNLPHWKSNTYMKALS